MFLNEVNWLRKLLVKAVFGITEGPEPDGQANFGLNCAPRHNSRRQNSRRLGADCKWSVTENPRRRWDVAGTGGPTRRDYRCAQGENTFAHSQQRGLSLPRT